uniref:Protein lifeguard 2 n=1 Tax=Poecilia reticulata TaxID=8081 RepID=A0A3P9PKB5_POERE
MKKSKVSKVFLLHVELDQVGNENEPPSYQEATAGYPEMEAQFAWDDKTIRRTFIRKVYAILMLQLSVTVGIVCLFTFCAPVRFYIQTNPSLYMASYIMFFATYIALSCCGDLSMAFMMGFVSSFYNTKSVMLCLGITALVCLSVTVFSFQSKIDVTSCQGVLFSLCMVMLLCAITISIVVPFGYVSSLVTCHLCSDRSHPLHPGKSGRIQPQTLMYHRSCGYRNKVYYGNYSYI